MEAHRLQGRTAVVTGAARGIGKAIAQRLAAEGANVAIADVDRAEAIATANEIVSAGGRVVACETDVTSDAAVTELCRIVETTFGGCDILVNNAAVLDATRFEDLTLERFRSVAEVNLHGALRLVLTFAPLIKGSSFGRIINVASIMGVRGSLDSIAYSTAKAGLINLTRCLACDLAPVQVNAIAPGFVNTRMALLPDGSGHEHQTDWFKDVYVKYRRLPLQRAAEPEEIAGVAFFLASDDSAYVTGQVLLVDGGVSATF